MYEVERVNQLLLSGPHMEMIPAPSPLCDWSHVVWAERLVSSFLGSQGLSERSACVCMHVCMCALSWLQSFRVMSVWCVDR